MFHFSEYSIRSCCGNITPCRPPCMPTVLWSCFAFRTTRGTELVSRRGLNHYEDDMMLNLVSLTQVLIHLCPPTSCRQVLVSSRHGPLVRCCGKFPRQGEVPFETGNGVEVAERTQGMETFGNDRVGKGLKRRRKHSLVWRALREGGREGGGERTASYDDWFLSNTIKQRLL